MIAWWELLITFSAGFLFSFLAEYVRSRSAGEDRKEERENRRLDRVATQELRADGHRAKRSSKHLESQLTWLVELQDVLSDFMRAFGEIEHADIMAVRDSGSERIRLPLLEDGLDERANVLQRRAIVLASRIDAEDVREGADSLMKAYGRYGMRAEVSTADIMDRGTVVATSFTTSIHVIGESLRRLAAD